MNVSRFMGALALSVLALGCGSDDDNGTNPSATLKIEVAGGNLQPQQVGKALATNLTAKVTNSSDQPVSGKTVNWTVSAGGGTLTAPTSVTNAEGIASIGYTVGPAEGSNTITATIADQPTASVAFTALARWETFTSSMSGAGENPALVNSAIGTATYKLLGPSTMSYEVQASGLTGNWTGLHIHATCCTSPATTAGVIVNLCPAANNCAIAADGTFRTSGTFTAATISSTVWATSLTEQQKFDSLLVLMRKGEGGAYTNIHTSLNTSGQARGPVTPKAPAGTVKAEE